MTKTLGIASIIVAMALTCSAKAEDWPQWRGPNRDNKVTGFTEPKTWPKELTKKWTVAVGMGESSPVMVGEKVYAFGRQGGDEVTLCLDAKSGKEIWKDTFAAEAIKGPAARFPGPRSTPVIADGKICTLGVGGVVSCLDAATGKVIWRQETKSKPQFYTSTSPMIVEGKCIVYVDALTAYDLASGKPNWQWKGSGAPYGSPVLLTVDGSKQIVTPTTSVLAGIEAADGKLLWEVKLPQGGYQNNYSTPVIDGPTVIYSVALKNKGSGTGTTAFKIEKKAGGFAATELWKKDLASDKYHAPVLKDGLLFSVSTGMNFYCMDAKTGEQLWLDDKNKRGECGSVVNAGSVLLSLSSDKNLVAFKPSPKEYTEVAKYTVAEAETWAIPIIAGNRIYVRDKAGSLTLWTMD